MRDRSFRNAKAVTPDDTDPLTGSPSALYVGVTGNVACRLSGDSADVTFVGVPAGAVLEIEATHVRSTSTTATDIIALYE